VSDLLRTINTPSLLVSVRNDAEALAALVGGADVIDVKEPSRGSLGAADPRTIADVVRSVNGRAIVSAAMGELVDMGRQISASGPLQIPADVQLFKIGLAGCAGLVEWKSEWRDAVQALQGDTTNSPPQPVAVVYADWKSADAPPPQEILDAAQELGCLALLIDTWDKSAGALFDHWDRADLGHFLTKVRTTKMAIVLAGSLSRTSLPQALGLGPDLVAVRGAACDRGRDGTVTTTRVRELTQIIAAHVRADPRALVGRR
jgi:(5-formylfuran-3-yl)methyl phosphate synthase